MSKNNLLIIIAHILICFLFIPYLWYGESIQIRVFDNLESNVVWLKMALESGQLFKLGGTIDQMMNGLPLHSIYGTYDISLLIFYIFGIFKGYVICKFLMMLVAFWGMYMLLVTHIAKKLSSRWICICVSFLFAILPFWSFEMHVAGIPFVMYAFLNLRNRNVSIYNWLILFVFAFWSSLVVSGFFILLIFACIWVYDIISNKRWGVSLFFGLVFLSGCFLLSHFPFFYAHFFMSDNYISIRTLFDFPRNNSLIYAIYRYGLSIFAFGDNTISRHSVSNHIFMLIPVFVTLLLMLKNKKVNKLFVLLLIYCSLSSLYFAINESKLFYSVRMWIWSIFPLNTIRIYWLNTTFWYIIIAISLVYILQNVKKGAFIVICFILVQSCYSLYQLDYFYYKRVPNVKFKDFYATTQYSDINKFIGKSQNTYRIINLGVDPAIALYNGFYTIDGFSIDYSVDYKRKFRKIIEKELEGSCYLNVFDKWGARCLLFANDIHVGYDAHKEYIDRELLFDFDQMKVMGAEYIISSNEINTAKNNRLILIKEFPRDKYRDRGEGAYWDLYLYEID